MNMTEEELELLAFDPPHLGMPGRPSGCGRSEDGERFVEIFVSVENGLIVDAGFLTNIPGDGLICASLCCDAALGRTAEDAAALGEAECLARLPEAVRNKISQAGLDGLCLLALLRAVREAGAGSREGTAE